jgi:hypothetical protein
VGFLVSETHCACGAQTELLSLWGQKDVRHAQSVQQARQMLIGIHRRHVKHAPLEHTWHPAAAGNASSVLQARLMTTAIRKPHVQHALQDFMHHKVQ